MVPESFSKIVEGLSTSELRDLRVWNSADPRPNKYVNKVIDAELNKRASQDANEVTHV